MSIEATERLSLKVILPYASMALPISALGMPLIVYLPPFYADHLGLGTSLVGLLFLVARSWDIVTDPIMGMLVDRYPSRWGRRKHWLGLSVPVLMLAIWALFLPDPEAVNGFNLGAWLLVLYTGWTLLVLSHVSWVPDLSADYHDRTRIYMLREISALLGMLLVLSLPAVIEWLGGDSSQKLASMGILLLISLPLCAVLCLSRVPDPVYPSRPSTGWRQTLGALAGNPPLLRLLAARLLLGLGIGTSGALYLFVLKYALGIPEWSSTALLLFFCMAVVGLPLWQRISLHAGKHRSILCSLLYSVGVLLLIWWFRPTNPLAGLPLVIAYGLAYACFDPLIMAMVADLVDHDEAEHSSTRGGLIYAVFTSANKLGFTLAVGILFLLVKPMLGFDPRLGADNSPEALEGLLALWVFLPIACYLISAALIYRYPLDANAHRRIRSGLATQRAPSDGR